MKTNNLFFVFIALLLACSSSSTDILPGSTHKFHAPDYPDSFVLMTVPEKYTPNRAFPLLIALHGSGDRSEAFHDFWKKPADSLSFILVTPQGLEKRDFGFGWSFDPKTETYINNVITEVKRRVLTDTNQIYFAGFSSGGSLAAYLTLQRIVPGNGAILFGSSINSRWIPSNDNGLKLYIGHGTLEPNYSLVKAMSDTLSQSGYRVKFNSYEGVGHNIPEPKQKELLNALRWSIKN